MNGFNHMICVSALSQFVTSAGMAIAAYDEIDSHLAQWTEYSFLHCADKAQFNEVFEQ